MREIAADHGRVHPRGDREVCPAPPGRGHRGVLEVGRIRANGDHPADAGALRSGQGAADHGGGAVGRGRRAPTQPDPGDHRRGLQRRDRSDLRTQSVHAAVAVTGTLLRVAVRGPDRVIDIDERDLVATGQHARHPGRKPCQDPGGDRIQLAHMPERVTAQVSAQSRGGPPRSEGPVHPAMT